MIELQEIKKLYETVKKLREENKKLKQDITREINRPNQTVYSLKYAIWEIIENE